MTTTKVYDNLNRLLDIASATGAPASPQSRYSYVYDAANQRSRATLADGSYWVYKYDALGQVIGGVKNDANGIPLPGFAFGYAFDDIGNRTSTSSSTAAAPSVYDANPLNQYEQRTVPGVVDIVGRANPAATVTLTIQDGSTRDILPVEHRGDFWWMTLAVENANSAKWLGITVTGVRNNIGPNGEDAVTEQRGHRFIPKTPELFTYDADGNLTADGRWSYTWDAENRLIAMETLPSVLPAPRSRLVFTYDALSRRIAKKVFAWSPDHWSLLTDHLFVYDGWNLIAELALDVQSSTLSVQRSYVWGLDLSGSLQGAGGVGGLLAVRLPSTAGGGAGGEGSTHLACYDGNGNIVALFDAATGAESATFEYSPFGETLVQSYADPLARQSLGDGGFRFSTKYTDPETGLLYYGYRYYSPSLGRWLGRDPVEEEGGENVYGLVGNSPSTFFDPVGLAIYAFDGTGNNMSDPNAGPITNVAILFNAYNGLHRRYYAGIGTDGDSISGGLTGNGGQLILRQAYEHLQANFEEGDKEIVIIGFSRGAALARNFANMISRRGNPGTWAGTDMPYARSANQEAGRCPPEIKFLGVFDTVASFGIPDNDVDFMYSFGVPSNVKVARHATARHERRGSFALMSMLPYAGWSDPTGRIVENTFDGAHADVGGGYADNGLSIHSLMWMAQEGRNAGVDFGPLDISTIRNHKAVLHNSAPGFDVLSKLFGTDHPAIGSIGSWLNERSKRKIFYPDSTAPETIQ